jgi:hypothetical protein
MADYLTLGRRALCCLRSTLISSQRINSIVHCKSTAGTVDAATISGVDLKDQGRHIDGHHDLQN